jgi:DNA repair exonuclease SbcCD ATPase subunit
MNLFLFINNIKIIMTHKLIIDKIKYRKIYHISDIHIRNTEEHIKIYEHVFNNLYEYLESVKSDTSMIVITGDVLHNKDKLTTICETLCIDFFERLSKIMTTIVIPGNHDFNERNNSLEDSLSTILYKRTFKNLYYLRNSGIYKFGNILFGVSSLIDGKFIKSDEISDEGIKIGLYHGPIANSKNSKGFEFSKNSITIFDGYDLVLLGDIHYHQYLNENKTIAYASSLISQNFAETDNNHGVLVWNLKNKESFYKPIHNDYRYDEIDIKHNKIFYKGKLIQNEELELPLYGKLRINTINCDQDFYNKTIFNIKSKYPNLNIVHNKLLSKTGTQQNKIKEKNTITLQSVVDSEIKKLPEETRKYIEKILLKEIKSAIQSVDEKLNWRLLTLEFSNMFSYGPNNIIDFTQLTFDEITGLFGPNSIGKSSLIDILLFSLFNDYSRNYQDKHKSVLNGAIINTKEDTFSCKVSFCIDNSIYFVEKEGNRKGAKSENTSDNYKFTKFDFYKIESNNKIDLNGQDRFETNDKIKKLIGSYTDFCLSSVCLQNNIRDKIDFFIMSPNERKLFLNKRLKFDIFNNIEEKYKDLLKETKINVKNIEKMDEYQNYDHNSDILIKELSESVLNYENIKTTLEDQLKNNNDELNKLYQKLKHVDKSIDCISHDKLEIINSVKIYKNKLKKYLDVDFDEKIEQIYNNNLLLSSKLSTTEQECNLDELIEQKNKLIKYMSDIKIKINNLHLIKNKETIISNNQIFEKQKTEKIINIRANILPNYKIISKNKIQNKILENLKQICISTEIPDYNQQINDTQINILNIENDINNLQSNINNIQNIIDKYDGITIDDNINILYNSLNFDEYYINTTNILNNYNKYYEINKVIETNDEIFTMLNDFNNCINTDCSNCLKHSNNINKLFSKLNIHEDCSVIRNKFLELQRLKNEYEQIIVYHYNKKLSNYQSLLELYSSILEHEKNKLNYYFEKANDNTIGNFKVELRENIIKMEQNNLLHELNETNDMVNEEYLLLNDQMIQYNQLTEELNSYEIKLVDINKNIDNYCKDNNIFKQIDNNNNIIQEFKNEKNKMNLYNSELSKLNNILDNIYNYEYNLTIYSQINDVKKNIQLITNNIISVNNEYNNKKHLQLKLINNKDKYLKYINELKKYNALIEIYENIIRIIGPKGIPRQIINIKLQHIEDTVNDIIMPFINKRIYITKEIDDIKVLINDGISKYYSCGGMENFIISMAFKIAFTNTFNIPQSGILFIDEGVSVLDKNHVSNFRIISNFIKQYYNHIILITHIDSFYDYTFEIINITKNKVNQSYIQFPSNIIKDDLHNITHIKTNKTNKPKHNKTIKPKPITKKNNIEIEV